MATIFMTPEAYKNWWNGRTNPTEAPVGFGNPKATKKLDLIREARDYAAANGLTELTILKYSKFYNTDCYGRRTDFAGYAVGGLWYVYQENGEWFFKMYGPQTKTAHRIQEA